VGYASCNIFLQSCAFSLHLERTQSHYCEVARQYSSLHAPRFLLPRIVLAAGPHIARMNRLPRALPEDIPLSDVLEELTRTATVRLHKVPYIDVAGTSIPVKMTTIVTWYLTHLARAVGNVGMSVAQLVANVNPVIAQVTKLLRQWNRVKRITLHATQGPSFTVYTANHAPPARPVAAGRGA